MLELTLTKNNSEVSISNYGYYLTWVYKPIIDGKTMFEIVPCSMLESNNFDDADLNSK